MVFYVSSEYIEDFVAVDLLIGLVIYLYTAWISAFILKPSLEAPLMGNRSIHPDPVLIRPASTSLSIHTWAKFSSWGKKGNCAESSVAFLSVQTGSDFLTNLTSDAVCQQTALQPRTRRFSQSRGPAASSAHRCYLLILFVITLSCTRLDVDQLCCIFGTLGFGEQRGVAGPQWQPGGSEASDGSVALWSWQTGLLSGPRHPGRPSLPLKFKYTPSHKCIMGTRIPRLHTYRALTLRLWAPEHTGNCGHPVVYQLLSICDENQSCSFVFFYCCSYSNFYPEALTVCCEDSKLVLFCIYSDWG